MSEYETISMKDAVALIKKTHFIDTVKVEKGKDGNLRMKMKLINMGTGELGYMSPRTFYKKEGNEKNYYLYKRSFDWMFERLHKKEDSEENVDLTAIAKGF